MKPKIALCLSIGSSLCVGLLMTGCSKEEKAVAPPNMPPQKTTTTSTVTSETTPKMQVKGGDPATNAKLEQEFKDAK